MHRGTALPGLRVTGEAGQVPAERLAPQPREVAYAVVPAGAHLQQLCPGRLVRIAEPVPQPGAHRQREPDDPVGDVAPPIGRELTAHLVQAGLDLRVRLGPGAVDHRCVDVAEPHVLGQVTDIGVTPLGGADQLGEHAEPVVGHRARQHVVVAAPPVKDGDHDRGGGRHPAHRPE